ncbi:MAG: glycosyl hydrolase [Patescibacteria group bacterium]
MRQSIYGFFIFLLTAPWAVPALAQTTPTVSSISADVVSFSDPLSSVVTFAVTGTDLDGMVYSGYSLWLGEFQGIVEGGNATSMTFSFTVRPASLPSGDYPLTIQLAGTQVYTSEPIVHVVNIFSLIPDRKSTQKYLEDVPLKKMSKKRLGLNVHYALGGSEAEDATLEARLRRSKTKWMREHFSHEALMGEDQAAWFARYDKAMQFAADNNIHVVGMLAYGLVGDDYSRPSKEEWETFVDLTVNRYKHVVDAWEVWNEPDSPDYLDPSTVKNYVKLLKQASPIIRRNDPEAVILGGVLASPNADWAEEIFDQAGNAFDQLALHVYQCENWLNNGNLQQLDKDWTAVGQVVRRHRPEVKVWVTELGCSEGSSGVGEKEQRQSMKKITQYLLNTGSVEVVLLYTIRDRSFLEESDPYEAYFGLLNADFSPKLVWDWYRQIRVNTQ